MKTHIHPLIIAGRNKPPELNEYVEVNYPFISMQNTNSKIVSIPNSNELSIANTWWPYSPVQ